MGNNREFFKVSEERKDIINIENDLSLLDLPIEISWLIGSWLDTRGKGSTAKACRTFNNLFQRNLAKEVELLLAVALHYAASGKKHELEKILKKHPGLVYLRGTTLDHCGRSIHGTIYQIALGAKDWSTFPDRFEEMAEMIERHMRTLPKGEEEITLQKAEQFPEGWEEEEKKREENDSVMLKETFAAIDKSKTDEECSNAIQKFIDYLKSQNKIKIGYHFNEKLLSEAYELSDQYYYKFGGFNSRKNELALIKIIGNIQFHMTACLAMAHCDGLTAVTAGTKALSRNINIDDNTPFFSSELGSSHFVYCFCSSGPSGLQTMQKAHGFNGRPSALETYVAEKLHIRSNSKIQCNTFCKS